MRLRGSYEKHYSNVYGTSALVKAIHSWQQFTSIPKWPLKKRKESKFTRDEVPVKEAALL